MNTTILLKNHKRLLTLVLFACSNTYSFGQYIISSIDYNTPLYYGSDWGNPFGLGVTLKNEHKECRVFGRVSAFTYGGLVQRSYLDTASRRYTTNDRIIFKMPLGDSVLTKEYISFTRGYGLQVGLRRDFTLLTVPFYTSVHVGVFAQQYSYGLGISHTIHQSDTTVFDDGFTYIKEYTSGTNKEIYEDRGWAILPQLGIEAGLVLSAGKRLQFIPKIVCNLSYYRASGISDLYLYIATNPVVQNTRAIELQATAGLQVSYLFKK
jgi:hypothetical protein|tara:strand:- start:1977 stop:2771 length:795 start_codon:yes stop_codon:yes gene_type:complete